MEEEEALCNLKVSSMQFDIDQNDRFAQSHCRSSEAIDQRVFNLLESVNLKRISLSLCSGHPFWEPQRQTPAGNNNNDNLDCCGLFLLFAHLSSMMCVSLCLVTVAMAYVLYSHIWALQQLKHISGSGWAHWECAGRFGLTQNGKWFRCASPAQAMNFVL